MSEKMDQTLAVFLLDSGDAARRLLKTVEKIDKGDKNVKIVDAAIADHRKRGRVKVKQTHDVSGRKGGARGGSIGVIAGAVMLGPPGAVVGGAVGATLSGLYSRFRDVGIDDKFMRKVAHDIDRGKSAVFVQYEGDWSASIGAGSDAIRAEHGELIHSRDGFSGPKDVSESVATARAPANAAPTSYVGYASAGYPIRSPAPSPRCTASEAISSFEPITGSTASRPRPVTPWRRASQSMHACRVSGRPMVSG